MTAPVREDGVHRTDALVRLTDAHVVHKARSGGVFTRDRVYALTGADLTVVPGETTGVVGESGCGKSTLAKVLVGVQRPTSGTVTFRGRDLWSLKPDERRTAVGGSTGMIFQDPSTALNRRLPVRRILRDPLDVHRRGTAAERADRVKELMSWSGCPGPSRTPFPASSPAVSASAWRSPAPWPWIPTWWWPTNRRARWTCRSARRSSTFSSI